MQNARYQLPLSLDLTAMTLAQKLIPFLAVLNFFEACLLFGTREYTRGKHQKYFLLETCALPATVESTNVNPDEMAITT